MNSKLVTQITVGVVSGLAVLMIWNWWKSRHPSTSTSTAS